MYNIVDLFGERLYDEKKRKLTIANEEELINYLLSSITQEIIKEGIEQFTVISHIYKAINFLSDSWKLSNFIIFLKRFDNNKASESAILKRINGLKEKENWVQLEVKWLIHMLDSADDRRKALVLADLYTKFLNREFEEEQLLEYATILNRVFFQDLLYLKIMLKNQNTNPNSIIKDSTIYDTIKCERLISLGLVLENRNFDPSCGLHYEITYIGVLFCKILNENSYDKYII